MILPAGAFGGTVPVVAAGSPVGFVAVGSQLNLRADNPVLWSGTERGGWAAERSPIIPPIGERTDLRCPPRPSDPAAFASLDVGTAYASARVTNTAGGQSNESTITGLTDTQIRATMNLGSDLVVLTAGLNIPTGRSTAPR